MSKQRIAIFASGAGTTAEAVIRAVGEGILDAEICVLISNKQSPGVFERVKKCNTTYAMTTATRYISSRDFPPAAGENWRLGMQTAAEEEEILNTLDEYSVDLVLLLGYMKLVGKKTVDKYGYKASYGTPYAASMVNSHPGILPETKGFFGVHVQEHALKIGAPAGHCLSVVDGEYDEGPIVAEHRLAIETNETAESLFERIQVSERATIGQDIADFLQRKAELRKGL